VRLVLLGAPALGGASWSQSKREALGQTRRRRAKRPEMPWSSCAHYFRRLPSQNQNQKSIGNSCLLPVAYCLLSIAYWL